MRTILVVANQTLGGDELLAEVRRKLESGPAALHVVVPATPVSGDLARAPVGSGASGGGGALLQDRAFEVAERRLEQGLDRLRALGVAATGEVGDPDPLRAVSDVLARRQVDEVIVSTLPSAVSRWLHTDLPRRVQRRHHLPVTTVTASTHR